MLKVLKRIYILVGGGSVAAGILERTVERRDQSSLVGGAGVTIMSPADREPGRDVHVREELVPFEPCGVGIGRVPWGPASTCKVKQSWCFRSLRSTRTPYGLSEAVNWDHAVVPSQLKARPASQVTG